jgi:murein DD-endopeptidase MepM/ murein hydrolase activator NlpD
MLQVFPVGAEATFSRNFGEAHSGTDIFSSQGAPILAAEAGAARAADDPRGGLVVYLRADSGWRYYYAHLSGYEGAFPRRVAAGEVLGRMGSTGNAAGGPQHLHFQMATPDGVTVDPYDYLLRAQRGGGIGGARFPWLAVGAAIVAAWYFWRRK